MHSSWDTGGSNGRDIGGGTITDDSTGANTQVQPRFATASTVSLVLTGGLVTSATIAWAAGDFIRIHGTYEAT